MPAKPPIALSGDDPATAALIEETLAHMPVIPAEVSRTDGLPAAVDAGNASDIVAILVDLAPADNSGPAMRGTVNDKVLNVGVIGLSRNGERHLVSAAGNGAAAHAVRYAMERERAASALRVGEERYRRLVEMSTEPTVMHSQGRFVFVNQAAVRLFGASAAEQLIGKRVLDFVHPRGEDAVRDVIGALAAPPTLPLTYSEPLQPVGSMAAFTAAATPDSDRDKPPVQGTVSSQREPRDYRLRPSAQYDHLTDLPNRHQFRTRLSAAMARAGRTKQVMGIMLLNLDGFKTVNTVLGHRRADLVLKEIADRLKQCLRKGDTAARLGGDEFAVILEGVNGKQGAAMAAQRALEKLSRPLSVDGRELLVTATIGIALCALDAVDLDELLRTADVAMCDAKDHARNSWQFYSPELDIRTLRDQRRRDNIEQRLARLTPREREVEEMLLAGKTNQMIADLLGVSKRTVETHRASIMGKMEAASLAEMVRMVLEVRRPSGDAGDAGAPGKKPPS